MIMPIRKFSTIHLSSSRSLFLIGISLNLLALCYYYIVASHLNYFSLIHTSIYSAPDSENYRAIADWLMGKAPSPLGRTLYRPLLYPAICAAIRSIVDSETSIWFCQFLFWILSVNFVAVAARKISGRMFFYIVAFTTLALNQSLILITFHGLTETTSVFFAALFTLLISRGHIRNSKPRSVLWTTLALSCATIVKPVFAECLYVYCFVAIIFSNKRKHTFVEILIGSFPFIAQHIFMLYYHHTLSLSTIGGMAFRNYLYSHFISVIQKVYPGIIVPPPNAPMGSIVTFCFHYPKIFFVCYYDILIRGNIVIATCFANGNMFTQKFTYFTNYCYLFFHLVFITFAIYFFLTSFKESAIRVLLLYCFALFIIATSGISFWQGDRLVLAALPLWIVAYCWLFNEFFILLQRLKNTGEHTCS